MVTSRENYISKIQHLIYMRWLSGFSNELHFTEYRTNVDKSELLKLSRT